MNSTTETPHRLGTLDWVLAIGILAFTALCVLSGPLGLIGPRLLPWVAGAFTVVFHPLIIVWMIRGGARSRLWEWPLMPIFWPWGWVIRSTRGRWIYIVLLLGFSIACGIVGIIGHATGA